MARTVIRPTLYPSATNERALPLPGSFGGYHTDLGLIEASPLDENSLILLPEVYIYDLDYDGDESLEAAWRESSDAHRCWQTTVIYEEHLTESHPHLVPFLRRDPWTAFPILAKPSGPPLVDLIKRNRATMYSAPLDAVTSRVQPAYRPLIYQWVLHFISVLSFLHERHIILGDFDLGHFWLSSDPHLSLSLVGFVNAGFWRRSNGVWYSCNRTSGEGFHALEPRSYNFTTQTDLFLYGCVVYEFMTGFWPGNRIGKSSQEIEVMRSRKEWPLLETEHMGEIVRKCWNGNFEDAKQVKMEVVAFLDGLGWRIEGNDDLEGFDVKDLELQLLVEMRNSRGR